MILWYEEGYPDRPRLDVGDDDEWDWISTQFLNESSVTASDDSVVGQEVLAAPSLVDAFNDHIPQNGVGTVDVPIAVKGCLKWASEALRPGHHLPVENQSARCHDGEQCARTRRRPASPDRAGRTGG